MAAGSQSTNRKGQASGNGAKKRSAEPKTGVAGNSAGREAGKQAARRNTAKERAKKAAEAEQQGEE